MSHYPPINDRQSNGLAPYRIRVKNQACKVKALKIVTIDTQKHDNCDGLESLFHLSGNMNNEHSIKRQSVSLYIQEKSSYSIKKIRNVLLKTGSLNSLQ